MDNKLIEKIRNYTKQASNIGDSDDKYMYLSLLKDMIEGAKDYVDLCTAQAIAIEVDKHRMDEISLMEKMHDLQTLRSRTHNAFCMTVKAVDRACQRLSVGEIYGEARGNHRMDFADFAIEIVDELFKNRPKKN